MLQRGVNRLRAIVRTATVNEQPEEPSAISERSLASLRVMASNAQDAGNWKDACDLWQQVTEQDPALVNGWLQLGNMLNEMADYDRALTAFSQAANLDTTSFDAFAGAAGVHERAGQWPKALGKWLDAARLPLSENEKNRKIHALTHAVLAAHQIGDQDNVARVTMLAIASAPNFLNGRESLPLRAKLLRSSDPKTAKLLYQEHLGVSPNDTAALYELASLCLEDGDYQTGLKAMQLCLAKNSMDSSFVWLTADLHERLRHWEDVLRLCIEITTDKSREVRFIRRGFDAAVKLGDLSAARRFAREFTIMSGGELELIDRLRSAYEAAGETRRARLLCRWLTKRWPHSRWHLGQSIILTAGSLGLVAADRLTRDHNARHGRDEAIDRAYCHAAFAANEHAEALRRLEWYLGQRSEPDNDTEVLLGYVLANAKGLDSAEQYFLSLAARTFQSKSALIGLAHMASRRRDARATVELWAKISAMYPDDTVARVEYARASYNLDDPERARTICEQRLLTLPSDVTMGEFYVWLLVATGNHTAAQAYLPILKLHGGPSWAGLEASVHCAGQLGTLDQTWPDILEFLPRGSTRAASSRIYHIARLLQQLERPDLAGKLLNASNIDARQASWLAPYGRRQGFEIETRVASPATTTWQQLSAHVRDGAAQKLRRMSGAHVRAALMRPKHEHPVVHVINKFEQARGGSELHALDVAVRISRHAKVELWAPEMPHPTFSGEHGVQAIDRSQGRAPHGGVLVIIGVYFPIDWIAHTRPERIIFLYNTFEAPMLFERIAEVFALTGVQAELLFCSDMMGEECGLPGFFEPSPIDIQLFSARPAAHSRPFTLGRHSRDVIEKHHADDRRIYQAVGELGGKSVVLGGTCMRSIFKPGSDLELLPAKTTGIAAFLQGLDAYLYRTSTWVEPWGRVVIEAMACELPVLVHDVGGYAQVIEHEKNGLLFHSTDEAVRLVKRLVKDADLRQRLGTSARATVEHLLGEEAMERLTMFYLMRD